MTRKNKVSPFFITHITVAKTDLALYRDDRNLKEIIQIDRTNDRKEASG